MMRLGTANTYDNTQVNLTNRQAGLAELQEKLSAGKKVLRASDDPTGMAQAERAMTRLARIETEQRSLNIQRNSMSMVESALGESVSSLQAIRELVVSAGNGTFNSGDRTNLSQRMAGLRDLIFANANKLDSNGIPLFGGLASASAPFLDISTGVQFEGIAGQSASTPVAIPSAMDGQAVWMNASSGNGVFKSELNVANTGTAWTDVGQVTNPSLVTGHDYSINFSVIAGVTTYDIVDTTTATTIAAAQPYTNAQAIQFDGLAVTPHGVPANGDSVQITPSVSTDIFKIIDNAIAKVNGASSGNVLTHDINLSLTEIDTALGRLHAARGMAGDLLNRADTIDSNQQTKSVQIQADRSRAEDLDMVKAISDFQNQQTGYSAALQTYAQVQRLSLFNYLS